MEKSECMHDCAGCENCKPTDPTATEEKVQEAIPFPGTSTPNENESSETENEQPADEATKAPLDPNDPIDKAVRQLITNVYNSVDYKNIFKLLGQEDRYQAFDDYVVAVAEQDFKLPEGEVPKTWWSFLEERPATSMQMAEVIEYFINMSLNVGIAASKVVTGSLYDALVYPQFLSVQRQHEMFAHELGRFNRELDRLRVLHPNEEASEEKANEDDIGGQEDEVESGLPENDNSEDMYDEAPADENGQPGADSE